MSSIGFQDLIVVAAAMALPCFGFLILGALILMISHIRNRNRQNKP